MWGAGTTHSPKVQLRVRGGANSTGLLVEELPNCGVFYSWNVFKVETFQIPSRIILVLSLVPLKRSIAILKLNICDVLTSAQLASSKAK